MTQMSLVLVNQALARQYAPNGSTLGQVLTISGLGSDPSQSLTPPGNNGAMLVVGLVPDAMNNGINQPMRQMQSQIDEADTLIAGAAGDHEACRRQMAIPGVGPVTATAALASVGDGTEFRNGRSFAAWLVLAPEQRSTGGKQKLPGISKRGSSYLRKLLVHWARAVLQCRDKQSPGLSAWLNQLVAHAHTNIVAVALASKMARIVWAVLAKGEAYRPPLLATSTEALACKRQAWISLRDSHNRRPATTDYSHGFLPGLLANREMAQ
jgi:hypothetical protein